MKKTVERNPDVLTNAKDVVVENGTTTDGKKKGIALNKYLNAQKPVILFESSGKEDDITLKDNYTNYSYIEVYAREVEGKTLPLIKINNSDTGFTFNSLRYDSAGIVIHSQKYSISSNKINVTGSISFYAASNVIQHIKSNAEYWRIKIIKVVGYK